MIFNVGLPRSEGAHRVLGDVTTAYHLCKHICERTGLNLRQLSEASAEPMLVHSLPFGKHKGDKLSDVPTGYLNWMLNTMDGLDADLKFSAKQILNKRK